MQPLCSSPYRVASIRSLWMTVPLVILLAGCNLPPLNVWVYIDNAGTQPLVVRVDGKEATTIAAGEVGKLEFPPGEYRFEIRRGDEVVCDLPRTLEKSNRMGTARKYLFNPDKLNRYQTYEVKYGGNRLGGMMESGVANFQKDPKIRNRYFYKKLLKEIELIPSDAWNDVTGIDYVLTAPPERLVTRSGGTRVTVLDRISQRGYERLQAAALVTEPTKADLEALDALIEEILDNAL